MNGKEICDLFGQKPGKQVGLYLKEAWEFQVLNGKDVSREELEKYLLENKEAIVEKCNK